MFGRLTKIRRPRLRSRARRRARPARRHARTAIAEEGLPRPEPGSVRERSGATSAKARCRRCSTAVISFTLKVSPKLASRGRGTWKLDMLGAQDGPPDYAVDATIVGAAALALKGTSTKVTFAGEQTLRRDPVRRARQRLPRRASPTSSVSS